MRLSRFLAVVVVLTAAVAMGYPRLKQLHGLTAETELTLAIQNDDLAGITVALEEGASLRGKEDVSPLLFACIGNRMEAVRLLLRHGADVNEPGPKGYTPLMAATSNGNAEMVRLLLVNGANPNARTAGGNNALLMAVAVPTGSAVECVALLVAANANLGAANDEGMTPLLAARANGNMEIVQTLLNGGAEQVDGREGTTCVIGLAGEISRLAPADLSDYTQAE